jgi:hypothetical protein
VDVPRVWGDGDAARVLDMQSVWGREEFVVGDWDGLSDGISSL